MTMFSKLKSLKVMSPKSHWMLLVKDSKPGDVILKKLEVVGLLKNVGILSSHLMGLLSSSIEKLTTLFQILTELSFWFVGVGKSTNLSSLAVNLFSFELLSFSFWKKHNGVSALVAIERGVDGHLGE